MPLPLLRLICRCLIPAILYFSGFAVHAQSKCVPLFIKEYKDNGNLEAHAIKYLPGGEILVAGRDSTNPTTGFDAVFMKLSATGTIIWSNLVGGTQNDILNGICPLNDGGFLLYGNTVSAAYPNGKPLLVQVNSSGTIQWTRQLGFSGNGKDRIVNMKQAADGDIVAIMNASDSSATADAVVFKITTSGNVLWTQQFDNGKADGFTSLAFDGNTIAVAGFYTGAGRRGVITKINSSNGAAVAATTIYRKDISYQEEVDALEIFNNRVSYALVSKQYNPSNYQHQLVLVQKDMSGNSLLERWFDASGDSNRILVRRAPDNGFMLMRGRGYGVYPSGMKISDAGTSEWSITLAPFYGAQNMGRDFDLTGTDGYVFTGHYNRFENNFRTSSYFMKCDNYGQTANCWLGGGGSIFSDTGTCREAGFSWANSAATVFTINEALGFAASTFNPSATIYCEKQTCTDFIPLPEGCNKSYRVEYNSDQPFTLNDAVTVTDGGKIAVGGRFSAGLIIKTKTNGDPEWSKRINESGSSVVFSRIMNTSDGNVFVFGSLDYVVDHGASEQGIILKVANNGDVLWSRKLRRSYDTEIADITTLADGGFIMVMNEDYGFPPMYSYVIRCDAAGNMVWQKEIKHFVSDPIYRSVSCDGNSVYLGYDVYLYNENVVGFDKLDANTGKQIWSKRFQLDDFTGTRVNRTFILHDTLYAFLHGFKQTNFFSSINRMLMMRITASGVVAGINAINRGTTTANISSYLGETTVPVKVTITSNNEFVLADRVATATDSVLDLTRIRPDASIVWSHQFVSLKDNIPISLKTEGKSFLLVGAVNKPSVDSKVFTGAFMLRFNEAGFITTNPNAICYPADAVVSTQAYTAKEIPSRIDSIVPLTELKVTNGRLIINDFPVNAALICNEPASCTTVTIAGNGNACSSLDTIVYYLQNAQQCDMAVKWTYDTALFKPLLVNGDTIRLQPVKPGISAITASTQGACFINTQELPATVLLSAAAISLGKDTALCPGTAIDLDAGPGYASYLWNDNSSSRKLNVANPGKYYVRVTDNCGGNGIDTIEVKGSGSLFTLNGPAFKCNQDTISLFASPGFSNYQWSASPALNNANRILVSPVQDTRYYVSAQLWAGCTATDSLLVTVLHSPVIHLGSDTSLCPASTLQLQAGTGFESYNWSTGITNNQMAVSQPGEFWIRATAANGCISGDTIKVSYYEQPKPNLGSDRSICSGSSEQLSPGLFSRYLWNDGSVSSVINVSSTGLYWVVVNDKNGCEGRDTLNVLELYSKPGSFLKDTASICPGDEVVLAPLQDYPQYAWSGGSSARLLKVYAPGYYTLKVTDLHGCAGQDTVRVMLKDYCPNTIYFPNAFTPNHNGSNEQFKPIVSGNLEEYRFTVYNRFGQVIFTSSQPQLGWDGNVNGHPQSSEGYVWVCSYKFAGSPGQLRKGTMILLK